MSGDAEFSKVVYLGKNSNNNTELNENKTKQTNNNTKTNQPMPGQKIELSCSKEADEIYCIDFDSDADLFTNDHKSSPSSSVGRLSPTPLLHLNQASCCRKCKCCIRPFSQNNRSQEIAFRLKEKSKRRMEMESTTTKPDYNLPEMNDQKPRSDSNESNKICTLEDSCRCKECVRIAKICAELIAEEESNKKKKQKKKKKKQKKHDSGDNNDDDDDEYDKDMDDSNTLKDIEEEEFIYNPPVMFNDGNNQYKIANPIEATSMEQWIPVKTKAKTELPKSNKSVPTTPNNSEKIEFTNFMSEQKKKSSVDFLSKDLININLNDSSKTGSNNSVNNNNNTSALNTVHSSSIQSCTLTNSQKAQLISIDADLADKRDEISYAIQLISEAIHLDPKNPVLYINRSYYYERMTKYQKAFDDAEKAIALEDEQSFDEYREYSLFRRAKAYEGLEDYENAEKDYKSFLKLIEDKCKDNRLAFEALLPRIDKNLLILRLKKLVHRGYSLPLARLYATKFSTIRECLEKIKINCRTLKQKADSLEMHLQIFNLNECSNNNNNNKYVSLFNDDGEINSDEEIYFSDDDEFDIMYSKDRFNNPKDILSVKTNPNQYFTEEYHEQLNSKGQKALWIGNIAPHCDATLPTAMFSKFGNVTFCRSFTIENPVEHSSDVGYLLLHYDNDISPKLVMAYFREEVIPGLSKDGTYALVIRFRNKSEKEMEEEDSSEPAPTAKEHSIKQSSLSNANSKQQPNSECYYWRTTGCDRERCLFKHIPANKGIDKQHWMRRKH